jgi:hypothetical protein
MMCFTQAVTEDEQQAAMFAVQGGSKDPPHATREATKRHATPEPPFYKNYQPPQRPAADPAGRNCWHCDQSGHLKRNCRNFKADMLMVQGGQDGQGPILLRQPVAAMQVGQPDLQTQRRELQELLNRLAETGFLADDAACQTVAMLECTTPEHSLELSLRKAS